MFLYLIKKLKMKSQDAKSHTAAVGAVLLIQEISFNRDLLAQE
jgi:hypothetical protein